MERSSNSNSGLLPLSILRDGILTFKQGLQEAEVDQSCDLGVISKFTNDTRLSIIGDLDSRLPDDTTFFDLAEKVAMHPKLSYEMFTTIKNEIPASLQVHFTATNYILFIRDSSGEIITDEFLRFVQRAIDVERTCLRLMKYKNGSAAADIPTDLALVSEMEFERYIFGLIPEMHCCEGLETWFYPFYVFAASRRFLFFLDAKRTKKISIKKIAHSTIMEELLFLKRLSQYEKDMDPQVFQSQVEANWFDGGNAIRLYKQFVFLDGDKNGTLNLDELVQFQGTPREAVQYTYTACERIIEAHVHHHPAELDFKGFVDLTLAVDNKTHVASLAYFWRILDIDECGRLTPRAIKHFYDDIYATLKRNRYDAPSAEHVVIEVFDILRCNESEGATFTHFKSSGQGHVVANMLLDANGFWQYDNRESLMQQADHNEEES